MMRMIWIVLLYLVSEVNCYKSYNGCKVKIKCNTKHTKIFPAIRSLILIWQSVEPIF